MFEDIERTEDCQKKKNKKTMTNRTLCKKVSSYQIYIRLKMCARIPLMNTHSDADDIVCNYNTSIFRC
jgi:hypothetical protein